MWGQFPSSNRAVTGDCESGWGAVTGGWRRSWGWRWGMGMPLGQGQGPSVGREGVPPPPFKPPRPCANPPPPHSNDSLPLPPPTPTPYRCPMPLCLPCPSLLCTSGRPTAETGVRPRSPPRGVAFSNSGPQPPPPPPTPSRPPKVFAPVFLRFENLGERVSAKGAENFFLPSWVFFFSPYVSTLKILRILWRIQK